MSYKSIRAIVNMIAVVGLAIAYSLYATGNSAPVHTDMGNWAKVMLIFIGICIITMIIVQIIFHIFYTAKVAINEKKCDDKEINRIVAATTKEDEMDNLIQLKAMRIAYGCTAFGFLIALLLLVLDTHMLVALHLVFGSFFFGSLIEGCMSVYAYEKGI